MTYQPYDDQVAHEIVASFDARPEMLVQILQGFVERFGWISEDAIRQLAKELNLSRADVHGVVSYYHDFRTASPGNVIVKVCEAEACQAMGSRKLSAHAKKKLAGRDVTLEPVYCLGNCACSPAIMVDGKAYGRVSTSRFDEIIDSLGDEV
jgi:formate dehydrogenase subunit gamma